MILIIVEKLVDGIFLMVNNNEIYDVFYVIKFKTYGTEKRRKTSGN